jgi:peptidyl-dipeptidase Dcp
VSNSSQDANTSSRSSTRDNPLLAPWEGPFGGVPPFDRVRVADFMPAVDTAIEEALEEIERIAQASEPPSFANTLEPMERAVGTLDRVGGVIGVWRSTMHTAELQAIEGELMKKFAEYGNRVVQNTSLFRRVDAVHDTVGTGELTPEQERLAWLHRDRLARAGAGLEGAPRERLAEINRRLAELSARFDQNVLADESEQYILIEDETELSGMPEADREAAAVAAKERGFDEQWLIANTRSAIEPLLTHADRRDLRERAFRMFVSRGDSEGERDNKPIVAEMLTLRAERAALLGYPSHAHWVVEKMMAKTPERALALVEEVWSAALERVGEEVMEMRALARSRGEPEDLRPWDYRYYADKVRRPRIDFDWSEVEPYLQLDNLRDAMFWVAGELFGLRFSPTRAPTYHPEVSVWEVRDTADDRHVGLFYFDPFARTGKKSGAWMNHYRRQHGLAGGVSPIVSNNCNYLRGKPGEPVLISWTDATTLFHEFGHALHGLLSNVTYPSLAGTQVTSDYVEFPSQILEHWLLTPELLGRFALHHHTGEPIPTEMIERISRAERAGEAFSTVETLAAALVDMRLHLAPDPGDPIRIQRETLADYGMPAEVALRHHTPNFGHLFSSGYAAAYYTYLWADVLAADAAEAFEEAGGLYDGATAERLRTEVLSRGNQVDPEEGYRAFRGRDPEPGALMRRRGFTLQAGRSASPTA